MAATKVALQVAPQLMAPSVDVIVPWPIFVTESWALPIPASDAVALAPVTETMSDADFDPTFRGVNFTPTTHDEPLANGPVQPFAESAKLPKSDRLTLGVPIGDWPEFVTVKRSSLLVD
jgi:hypothetical protein